MVCAWLVIGEAMDDSMYLTFTLWLVSSFNNPLDIIEMIFLWKYDTEVLKIIITIID